MSREAVDTNVFVALFAGDEEASSWARHELEEASLRATLAVSPVVYAELVAGGRSPETVETFFSAQGIEVDWEMGKDVWHTAGTRYGFYARDRKRLSADTGPRRILADFLVGAHASQMGGGVLLTTDSGIFGAYFSEVRLVAPEE